MECQTCIYWTAKPTYNGDESPIEGVCEGLHDADNVCVDGADQGEILTAPTFFCAHYSGRDLVRGEPDTLDQIAKIQDGGWTEPPKNGRR